MSQVFVEFAQVATSSAGRDSPISLYAAAVTEITSSGTSQDTTAITSPDQRLNVVTVMNNGADTIWVNFGAAAAVGSGRPVMPNTARDFGNVPPGITVSVINDS